MKRVLFALLFVIMSWIGMACSQLETTEAETERTAQETTEAETERSAQETEQTQNVVSGVISTNESIANDSVTNEVVANEVVTNEVVAKESVAKKSAAEENDNSEESWTLGDLGHPRSSFELGSAKKLEGRNVIVSMFADSPDSKWEADEKEYMLSQLTIACDYIKEVASFYGQSPEMIYDWTAPGGGDLLKTGTVDWNIASTPMNKQEEDLDISIASWLETSVDYDALLKEYDANNIFMVVYLDTGGRPYAISYDGIDNPKESLIMYSGQNPSSVAHEILHLYGAHDFYKGAEYTDEAVAYLMEKYPNDIMLRTDGGDVIPNEVGELTAYHLGWINESIDVNEFQELSRYEY